jgi:hypothetical protein
VFRALGTNQHFRFDPECLRNPLHPDKRQVAHPRFQPPDRLRRRRRIARGGEVGEGPATLFPDVADAVDHCSP